MSRNPASLLLFFLEKAGKPTKKKVFPKLTESLEREGKNSKKKKDNRNKKKKSKEFQKSKDWRVSVIVVIAIANFHHRPEIAAIFGTLFKETLRF